MSSSGLVHAQTEVRTERVNYNWLIKGFDLLPEEVDEKIWSPWFYSRDNSEKWRLEFYPRGQSSSSSEGIDYVALYLARDSPEKSHIKVYAEMKISRSDRVFTRRSNIYKYGAFDSQGYDRFIERSKLFSMDRNYDEFIISCIIDIPVNVVTSLFDPTIFDSNKSQSNDDFRSVFKDPMYSDFTIIVGDKKFATHKVILASRSSVFAAMFEHKDLEENRKKEVKIENMEPDVIKGMLEFIYTNQVTNMKTLASGLLEAADKYDLEKLRIMCEKTLYEGLNKENAAEVLQLADLHHADTLKKCVMRYIVNYAPELVKSSNWRKSGWNLELLLELFDELALSHAANNEESQSSKA